jgi:hypothetical protein
MDERRFDTLTKLLFTGSGSRRRVLTVLVPSALAAGLFDRTEALTRKERRQCREKGGVPAKKGNCHCARTCDNITTTDFPCSENTECFCTKTPSGKGLCVTRTGGSGNICSSKIKCPDGEGCAVLPGCQFSDVKCKTDSDCSTFFGRACVQGRCQVTGCSPLCPT